MNRGTVLVVEDEAGLRDVLGVLLRSRHYETIGVGSVAEALGKLDSADVILTDLKLGDGDGMGVLKAVREKGGGVPVIVLTAFGTVDSAVEAVREGAYDYLTKPFDEERLLLTIEKALSVRKLEEENRALREELTGRAGFEQILTASENVREAIRMAQQVAGHPNATVLITGESGTGKELLARAIHAAGPRRNARFIGLNCAAIPDTLLESELFGYERGAFTGALKRKSGKLEVAHGGSLFLDEVGDIPGPIQVKLLRVLQERVFERLGGLDEIKVDVRIIAATNQDLNRRVAEGKFRSDLFYRLSVFPVHLPALRERKGDIELLTDIFLKHHAGVVGKKVRGLTAGARRRLEAYSWPGNVRELQNVIERAVILCSSEYLTESDLRLGGAEPQPAAPDVDVGDWISRGVPIDTVEKSMVERALEMSKGNQSEAAKLLGLTRSKLRSRLAKFKLG